MLTNHGNIINNKKLVGFIRYLETDFFPSLIKRIMSINLDSNVTSIKLSNEEYSDAYDIITHNIMDIKPNYELHNVIINKFKQIVNQYGFIEKDIKLNNYFDYSIIFLRFNVLIEWIELLFISYKKYYCILMNFPSLKEEFYLILKKNIIENNIDTKMSLDAIFKKFLDLSSSIIISIVTQLEKDDQHISTIKSTIESDGDFVLLNLNLKSFLNLFYYNIFDKTPVIDLFQSNFSEELLSRVNDYFIKLQIKHLIQLQDILSTLFSKHTKNTILCSLFYISSDQIINSQLICPIFFRNSVKYKLQINKIMNDILNAFKQEKKFNTVLLKFKEIAVLFTSTEAQIILLKIVQLFFSYKIELIKSNIDTYAELRCPDILIQSLIDYLLVFEKLLFLLDIGFIKIIKYYSTILKYIFDQNKILQLSSYLHTVYSVAQLDKVQKIQTVQNSKNIFKLLLVFLYIINEPNIYFYFLEVRLFFYLYFHYKLNILESKRINNELTSLQYLQNVFYDTKVERYQLLLDLLFGITINTFETNNIFVLKDNNMILLINHALFPKIQLETTFDFNYINNNLIRKVFHKEKFINEYFYLSSGLCIIKLKIGDTTVIGPASNLLIYLLFNKYQNLSLKIIKKFFKNKTYVKSILQLYKYNGLIKINNDEILLNELLNKGVIYIYQPFQAKKAINKKFNTNNNNLKKFVNDNNSLLSKEYRIKMEMIKIVKKNKIINKELLFEYITSHNIDMNLVESCFEVLVKDKYIVCENDNITL